MNIPPKYEDLVAQLDAAEVIIQAGEHVESHLEKQIDILRIDLDAALGREAALREELELAKSRYDREVLGLNNEGDPIGGDPAGGYKNDNARLQQRLTSAEQRESEAREELLELSRKLDVFYSRSHGIKNLSEIEKANDEAKNLKLKVREYEALLNISKELLTTISRHWATTKPVDWCDSFKAEVADRIEKIGDALKPAEGEGS